MTYEEWLLTEDRTERHAPFLEPCVDGFEHVLEAADESIGPIIRHLRLDRRRASGGPILPALRAA